MSEKPTYEELEQRVKKLEKVAVERKKVEEALRESEKRYRALSDATFEAIFFSDQGVH